MNPQLSLFDFSAPLQKTPEKKFLPPPQAKKERGPLNKPETKYNSQKPLSQIYAEVLVDYLPENSVTDVCNVLAKHKVFVRIT